MAESPSMLGVSLYWNAFSSTMHIAIYSIDFTAQEYHRFSLAIFCHGINNLIGLLCIVLFPERKYVLFIIMSAKLRIAAINPQPR